MYLPDDEAEGQDRRMSTRARRIAASRNSYFSAVAMSAVLLFVIAIIVGLI
jgi:predicted anti-sigma-YlaC factor YlaD